MPSISNAGGSLTSALALTLLAWAVRWWREEASKSKAAAQSAKAGSPRVLSRFHSGISLAALKLLVGGLKERSQFRHWSIYLSCWEPEFACKA